MRHATMVIGALLCLAAAGGAAQARTGRDPFEATAAAEVPSNYEKAIQQLTVKGIVRTETQQRIIVMIAGIDGMAVLKRGDKLALDVEGRSHVFRVETVEAKNVRFQVVPPASANASRAGDFYEVRIR